ncbi:MAG TPA: GNAT family N-acetyltransferase [Vicinamibacterales bacterium]|nr:GNAT family N-acetyltransferase [Vicinamibacterales bacterium]
MSIATARRVRSIRRPARVELRTADLSHASKLHALIEAHREEGHLLPRSLEEIELRAPRFVVAVQGDSIVGCAELAPLSSVVAEVRSLVVAPSVRGLGVGTMLVDELRRRGRAAGFDRLCAFTHCPGYFMQFGFSLVPHAWLGEKIAADCSTCALFRKCGQYAMVVSLSESHQTAARSTAIPVALLRRA